MSDIRVAWADANVKRFGEKIARLNGQFPLVLPRIINQVGNRAKTQVIRNLTKQTGLPRKTVVKAVGNPMQANAGKLSYSMITRGGNIRLKYLAPKEYNGGVKAKPWGKVADYPKAFMKGGLFPGRKISEKLGGHVWRNLGRGERKDGGRGQRLTQVRSGMKIPEEMTTGATRKAFETIAGLLLQERVGKAIAKLIG